MIVIANGAPVELDEGATIEQLLDVLELRRRFLLVERNGEPVPRAEVLGTVLVDGDRLELVRAVAGG